MITKGKIIKGEYFDSVTLMLLTKEINKTDGVADSAVVMGTKENRSILETSGMLIKDFDNSSDNDLLICIKADSEKTVEDILGNIDGMFKKLRCKKDEETDYSPKSLDSAIKLMPGANLSLISVAGKYAAAEALKALKKGLHVMIFSDNVSIEDELKLKKYGAAKGLLVMGPDCGTAVINGAPLAFANVVNRGNIGIVAASGTGLQEISCVISNEGAGISQAIGTGGRDVKKEIGGIMFIEALQALNNDKSTDIIVLVSKPPHDEVLDKITKEIRKIKKPVVAILIGGDAAKIRDAGAIPAATLEETGLIAASLSKGINIETVKNDMRKEEEEIILMAKKLSADKGKTQKYLRGLFSGGTLCDETQLILKDHLGFVYSNTPLNNEYKLADSWKSKQNTVIDLGEDEFTVGRPHPMIDYTLRTKKIANEASDTEVSVILLDIVLGYGSNLNPAAELVSSILKAKEISPGVNIICSITGTDLDPQNRNELKQQLEKSGAIVMKTNAAASKLAAYIVKDC